MTVQLERFRKPSQTDFEILTRLRAYLNLESKTLFTADTLYELGLVRLLSEPHNRTVGSWFQKMQKAGFIEGKGVYVPSKRSTNNNRRIQVYEAFPKGGF